MDRIRIGRWTSVGPIVSPDPIISVSHSDSEFEVLVNAVWDMLPRVRSISPFHVPVPVIHCSDMRTSWGYLKAKENNVDLGGTNSSSRSRFLVSYIEHYADTGTPLSSMRTRGIFRLRNSH